MQEIITVNILSYNCEEQGMQSALTADVKGGLVLEPLEPGRKDQQWNLIPNLVTNSAVGGYTLYNVGQGGSAYQGDNKNQIYLNNEESPYGVGPYCWLLIGKSVDNSNFAWAIQTYDSGPVMDARNAQCKPYTVVQLYDYKSGNKNQLWDIVKVNEKPRQTKAWLNYIPGTSDSLAKLDYLDSNSDDANEVAFKAVGYGKTSEFKLYQYSPDGGTPGWKFQGITFWGEGHLTRSGVAQNFKVGQTDGEVEFLIDNVRSGYIKCINVADDLITFTVSNEYETDGGIISLEVTILDNDGIYLTSRDPDIPVKKKDD